MFIPWTMADIFMLQPGSLNISELSAFFANFSFLLLFGAMFLYWLNLAFSTKSSYVAKSVVSSNLLFSTGESAQMNTPKTFRFANLANSVILLGNLFLFTLLCIRWYESGHFPLSNLYESLMFLAWCCTTVQLFLIWNYNGSVNQSSNSDNIGLLKDVLISELVGSVLAPCALFLNAFATFSLPKEMQQAGPLVPALQSNWLMMHVTVMIISYAALMLGSLLSIAYLILIRINNLRKQVTKLPVTNETEITKVSTTLQKTNTVSTIAENLDYLSYRIIGIGFPFLTIGILSGAVWANEAWGSYWSWDPKETWALLTWLVFAIYLHTRLTKGWQGEKPAVLASFGFIVVWICYLGVNLLGEGLHSYGFFNT